MGLYARLSVHELVDPLFRSGDLDDRIYNQETMAEGSRIHSKYQKKQRGDYLSEYPLECTIEAKLGTVYLFGRADGIKKDGDSVSIEEVKSTVADLDEFFAESEQWHLAQAKCYAYMYLLSNPKCRFARIRVPAYGEDELIVAVSEGVVLLQEGMERTGKGVFGAWLARTVSELDPEAARAVAAATGEKDGGAEGAIGR